MTNDLTIQTDRTFAPDRVLEENLRGRKLDIRDLKQIRIPLNEDYWTVAMADGDTMHQTLTGVIVHEQSTRTYYAEAFKPGADTRGKRPNCASNDGVYGTPGVSPDGTVRENGVMECATCPMDQFGDGTGKPCREYIWLYLWTEGANMPWAVRISPGSIGNWSNYLKLLVQSEIPLSAVVTTIGLTTEKDYSQATFEAAHVLDVDADAGYQESSAYLKSLMQPRMMEHTVDQVDATVDSTADEIPYE